MTSRLNRVPVYQWTHRVFTGQDPWAEGQVVRWSVVVYRLLNESFVDSAEPEAQCVPSNSTNVPERYCIGIHNRENGRYRVLPTALQDLWRAGAVRDIDLPALLYRIEAPLLLNDYPPGLMLQLMSVYMFLLGAFAVVTLAVGMPTFAAVLVSLMMLCGGTLLRFRLRRQHFAREWKELLDHHRAVSVKAEPLMAEAKHPYK